MELEEIKEIFCKDYCRYPREIILEDMNIELKDTDICRSCPFNKKQRRKNNGR